MQQDRPPWSFALAGDVDRVFDAAGSKPPAELLDDSGCSLLHYAAYANQGALVTALLTRGKIPPNIADVDGLTPLHVAAFRGHEAALTALLDGGADANARDAWGRTPLHNAALYDHAPLVAALLARGADASAQDAGGCLALHLASSGGHVACVRALIEAKPADIDARDWSEARPVHYAAQRGHVDTLTALSDAGAALAPPDRHGWTVLHAAANSGSRAMLEWVLDRCCTSTPGKSLSDSGTALSAATAAAAVTEQAPQPADNNANANANADGENNTAEPDSARSLDIDAQDKRGTTALHVACGRGHVALVQLLAQRGAKLNARDKRGAVPLHYAAANAHTECVRVLLDLGQSVDPSDLSKATPLHKACVAGAADTAAFLLTKGARVDAADSEGALPLHKAAFGGSVRCVSMLLDRGAAVAVEDQSGSTPLHKAVHNGHDQLAALLLKRGADAAAADHVGGQPLHAAAARGHVACVKLLLESKVATVGAVDERGNTAMHWAAASGSKECIELLKLYGADVNSPNGHGASPLFWALRRGHQAAAALLILLGAKFSDADKSRIASRDLRRLYGIVKPDILLELVRRSDGSAPPEAQELIARGGVIRSTGSRAPRPTRSSSRHTMGADAVAPTAAGGAASATLSPALAKGIEQFNHKPVAGIRAMQADGVLGGSPADVARLLYERSELNKRKVGEYLGEPDDYPQNVLSAFIGLFDFSFLDFDIALRRLLFRFRLPGEAQKIDRIMQKFARQYYSDNPGQLFVSSDAVYILAFACIMLNTDAHNNAIAKRNKMTKEQFLTHVRGINGGKDLPSEWLEDLYTRIVEDEIRMDDSAAYPDAVKKGWLLVSIDRSSPKRRYFILTDQRLLYFRKSTDTEPLDVITISADRSPSIAKEIARSQFLVKIDLAAAGPHKATAVRLQAPSELEMTSWFHALRRQTSPPKKP